ncbi:enoyl-CoA hydratase-related protein, partial [Streptomyces bambusae]|nr:hydrogenase maturation protein [Streptomyces bambusae]
REVWKRDRTPAQRVPPPPRAAAPRRAAPAALPAPRGSRRGAPPGDAPRAAPDAPPPPRAGPASGPPADGAVWIPELRAPRTPGEPVPVKLPATLALGDRLPPLPESPPPLPGHPLPPARAADRRTWCDIGYREEGTTGFLTFSFPGGAMSTDHCRRLLDAYRAACSRPTSVLVLGGGRDFFSNGIHLGVIEAAADPAAESWANINAIDDLVEAVLTTTDRLVVAALAGNAAAGGAMLALAADEVWCRSGVVLNPHYRLMGLYGSEYWTYTLPRRVGAAAAARLTADALPVSAAAAVEAGLADRTIACAPQDFTARTAHLAGRLAAAPGTPGRIAAKKARRERDEAVRPLDSYRAHELARMRAVFDDPSAPYHRLRRAFVRKERPAATPPHLRDPRPRRPDPARVTGLDAHDGAAGPTPC